jgi:hypothetical protein
MSTRMSSGPIVTRDRRDVRTSFALIFGFGHAKPVTDNRAYQERLATVFRQASLVGLLVNVPILGEFLVSVAIRRRTCVLPGARRFSLRARRFYIGLLVCCQTTMQVAIALPEVTKPSV